MPKGRASRAVGSGPKVMPMRLEPPGDQDGDHGAEGHGVAMGEVGKAQDAVDQRDPKRAERQLRAVGEAGTKTKFRKATSAFRKSIGRSACRAQCSQRFTGRLRSTGIRCMGAGSARQARGSHARKRTRVEIRARRRIAQPPGSAADLGVGQQGLAGVGEAVARPAPAHSPCRRSPAPGGRSVRPSGSRCRCAPPR